MKGRAITLEEYERMLAATMAVVTDVGRRRKDDKLPEEKSDRPNWNGRLPNPGNGSNAGSGCLGSGSPKP